MKETRKVGPYFKEEIKKKKPYSIVYDVDVTIFVVSPFKILSFPSFSQIYHKGHDVYACFLPRATYVRYYVLQLPLIRIII